MATAAACALAAFSVWAEPEGTPAQPKVSIALDMRADFAYDHIDSPSGSSDSKSGIYGRYLNLHVNGNITPELSYHWRQRMNKMGEYGNDVFAATDWAYIDYQFTPNFSMAGGKQVVLIGGYEYDAAPIDIFFASMFWNYIACYQFGASGSYLTDNQKHKFTFQVCNSPYQEMGESCYAYNLYWQGSMGVYSTLWSTNLIEYKRGHFAHFISLGNRLSLGALQLQLDVMNRATSRSDYFFDNYSLIGEAKYFVTPKVALEVKGGRDKYRPLPDTSVRYDNKFLGAGVEVFPLKDSRDLRLHAMWHIGHDIDRSRINQVSVGVKWRADIFSR